MKKLGLLYGKELLIDTEDEKIFKLAEKYLEKMKEDSLKLQELKNHEIFKHYK